MLRTTRKSALSLAAFLSLFGAGRATAQAVLAPPPDAACYSPPAVYTPSASYYAAPPASYSYAPAVSYYATPSVSYSYTPSVSYYAPAVASPGGAVTTTRYGLFGRPRVSTTYYYP